MDENVRAYAQMHEARHSGRRAVRTRVALIVGAILFAGAVALAVVMGLTVKPYP